MAGTGDTKPVIYWEGREQRKEKNLNQHQKEQEKKNHEEVHEKGNKKESYIGRNEIEKRGINLWEVEVRVDKPWRPAKTHHSQPHWQLGHFLTWGQKLARFPEEIRRLPSQTTLEQGGGRDLHSWAQEERGLEIWTNRGWGSCASVLNC